MMTEYSHVTYHVDQDGLGDYVFIADGLGSKVIIEIGAVQRLIDDLKDAVLDVVV